MDLLRRELRAVRLSAIYFTRLPLPCLDAVDADDLRRSAAYLPLVGWLVGASAAAVWWLASRCLPAGLAAGLAMAAAALFTGAMHEDGLADVCDGFGGGMTRERVLEIMQDSRVGAFALVGVAFVLGLRWQALAALPGALVPALLVSAHALSRGAAVSLMATQEHVRTGPSKARPVTSRLAGGRLALAAALSVAPLLLLPGRFAWALAPVLAARLVMARWFMKRIGGYTGDCLGAVQQVSELVFLVAALALA